MSDTTNLAGPTAVAGSLPARANVRSAPWCQAIIALALLIAGCESRPGTPLPPTQRETRTDTQPDPQLASPPARRADHLTTARRLLRVRSLDAAADAAYKALVEDPESMEARLVASQIEAARGNHQQSAELAASIDPGSRLGKTAVQLHYQQLVKFGQTSPAADVLIAALEVTPDMPQWHHQAWQLLTRTGRREEASRQAESLCRMGLATEQELLSLVRRTESFPTTLDDKQDPEKYFDAGLGMARWYFTQQQFRRALQELDAEYESGFRTAAAGALYGRLLAETQSLDEIPRWHAQCDTPQLRRLGDYWAALGTYFFDQRQFEASARALLEAVTRNPTDRVCFQRLGKVFDALGRSEDAEEFRRRGIQISDSERSSESLLKSAADLDARKQLTRQVMELGRPFETLQWTLTMLPAAATHPRAKVSQQRAELLQSTRALTMAAQASLLGIDPEDFDVQPALDRLSRDGGSSSGIAKPVEVQPLAQPRLVNVAADVGLDFQWYQDLEVNIASIPIHESVGGGIAVIDYDLDGWPDAYLGQGSGEPPTDRCTRSNQLFRNVAARFIDVTALAAVEDFNYAAGMAAGDVNQDGFPDLYLGSLGRNRLLINNGDGTFRDATSRLGQVPDRFTSSLAIADINGDALPDLFEGIYIEMEGAFKLPEVGEDGREIQPSPLMHYAQSDRWFCSHGDGSFEVREISREVARPGTSLGVVVCDFDGDGRNEIFVGNDVRPNHFLVQTGEDGFFNAADAKGVANGFSGAANGCMGIATGDFDRNGTLDLHIANFNEESNNLYLQNSGGSFTDLAIKYGLDQVSLPYVGFGTKAVDIDRNGWLDLIITNGHIFDMRRYGEAFQSPPQFLMGRGSRFELAQVDDDSGYWDDVYLGRSIAMLDFDRDGSLDFLVSHLDKPTALLHNQTRTRGHWVEIELVGTSSERDAIGARVVVSAGGQRVTQWVTAGDGYFCTDEAVLDFGILAAQQIETVEVFWPAGPSQTFRSLSAGTRYLVVEGEAGPFIRD